MSKLPPECEQLLISGYVLGNLSPAEALLFEEMLAENPSLNERVMAMQSVLDLAYNPEEIAPPPNLRDRILDAANEEKANISLASSDSRDNKAKTSISKQKIPWDKIFGAIALAVITLMGIVNYRMWQSIQASKTIEGSTDGQNNQNLTYNLSSEDSTQKPTAKLIVDGDRLKATLAVKDLPVLPPEKVYALWTVVGKDVPYTTDEKGAILTAVFQVDELGNFTQQIAVPQPHLEPRIIKKIAITVEDITSPQEHQGSIFISTTN